MVGVGFVQLAQRRELAEDDRLAHVDARLRQRDPLHWLIVEVAEQADRVGTRGRDDHQQREGKDDL